MGGSIRVIVREENGKIHKMVRWTNQLPYFVKNKKFFDADKDYISEYVNRLDGYRVDDNIMAPECYGIAVFDFTKKKIFNMQGYCSFSDIADSELYLSRDMQESDDIFNSYKKAKEMFDSGYLKFQQVSYNKKDYKNTYEIHDIEPISIDDFINYNFDEKDYIVTRIILSIDYDKLGWELIDEGGENEHSLFKIYLDMYNNGFEFSYKDNEVWEQEMAEKEEYWEGECEFPYTKGTFLNYKRNKQINELLS